MTKNDEHSPIRIFGRIIRFIFTTNNAIWFEKDLTKDIEDIELKIPLQIDFNSNNQTINWIKKQKLNWIINKKEIEIAKKYNHFWPSISNGENIIGILKVGFNKIYIADYDQIIDLPEKTAFLNDIYIIRDKRDRNIATFLTVKSLNHLKSKGFLKVKVHVPAWNKASIGVCNHAGFKKTHYIRFFRIFGITFFYEKTLKNFTKINGYKKVKGNLLNE